MKYLIGTLALSVLLINAFAQTKTSPAANFISVGKQTQNIPALIDTVSILGLEPITKTEFLDYRKKFRLLPNTDTTYVSRTDTTFTLKTFVPTKPYESDQRDYVEMNYYMGFLDKLNLYAIQYVSTPNNVAILHLVDRATGKTFNYLSPLESALAAPLLSPKSKYLLSYTNNPFAINDCYISVLKVNMEKNTYTLSNLVGMQSKDWQVKELFWISENSFVINAEARESAESEDIKSIYIKASLPQ